jgi:hypothetical protein
MGFVYIVPSSSLEGSCLVVHVSKILLWRSPEEFKNQYESQSGRTGSSFAASNADIPVERWGQHAW